MADNNDNARKKLQLFFDEDPRKLYLFIISFSPLIKKKLPEEK
jgi:hypothetical protein